MATFKAVLKSEKKKDGTHPIYIRITKDRRVTYVPLGMAIDPKFWNAAEGIAKPSYDGDVNLNNLIRSRLSNIADESTDLIKRKPNVSVITLKKQQQATKVAMVFEQAELYLKSLKDAGKYNQYTADKPRVKHLRDFLKKDCALQDLEVSTLEHFKSHIKNGLKRSERTAVNHLSMVRSVFSFARRSGLIKAETSPFGKGKIIIKFPESGKIGLSAAEIKRLETVVLAKRPDHCRNIWLFSFYFAGMRISDVLRLRWSDFQDGRLVYVMGKNDKVGSLKVPEKAERILEQYRDKQSGKHDFVFPELKDVDIKDQFIFERTIAFKTSAIDKCLKFDVAPAAGIEKTLTMHIARHTFATEAGDKVNIQMLQKLYRHSSIVTTIGYQSAFINKDADDALDAVLNAGQKTKKSVKKVASPKTKAMDSTT